MLRDGVELTKICPARWFSRKHEDQPTTEVAIRRTFAEDLAIVMPQFDASQQSANVEITVNPLVNWVWLGFGLLAFGALIALLPETAFAFAVGRVPDAAKTATASLLLLAIALPAAVQAQDGAPGRTNKTVMQRDIEGKVICMCGSVGCVRSPLNNCPMRPACHGYDAQTAQLQKFLNEGKGQDDILTAFVKEYGTAVLAIPQGRFNSLSWVLPYGSLVSGCCYLSPPRDAGRRSRRRPLPAVWTPSTLRSTPASTMSSETSTESQPSFEPWQLFTLAGLIGATIAVFMARGESPAAVIMISITIFAAAGVGIAALRTFLPLTQKTPTDGARIVGGRTRAALEREKTLLLRSIKELEFDRAMEGVGEGFRGDERAAARARGEADAPARRRRRIPQRDQAGDREEDW